MAGGGGGGESGEPEFQIAPMIDVLLVLLIFFMSITSAQVLKVDKGLTLPVSPNAKKRDTDMAKHECAVNIRWTGTEAVLTMDEIKYPKGMREQFTEKIKEKKKRDAKLRVVIRGDKALPAVEVQKVMDILAAGGADDIAFAASNK